jgi:hypothetical protein
LIHPDLEVAMLSSGMTGGRTGSGPSKARFAAFALMAVLAGVYIGKSTVAEINPFYLHGDAAGSSYTSDGWRGADASPPPAYQAPVEHRMDRFWSGVYALAPESVRTVADKVVIARDAAADIAAIGRAVGDYADAWDHTSETLVPEPPPAPAPIDHVDDAPPVSMRDCDSGGRCAEDATPAEGYGGYPEDDHYAYDEPDA